LKRAALSKSATAHTFCFCWCSTWPWWWRLLQGHNSVHSTHAIHAGMQNAAAAKKQGDLRWLLFHRQIPLLILLLHLSTIKLLLQ
jgi:hypothetical protein